MSEGLGWTALVLVVVGLITALFFGIPAYSRYQNRADAHNSVQVTHILIQEAAQQAQINRAQIAATIAEAQKRYQESVGIRRAQDEIQKTLTPLYVQHEAVQAQERMAGSPNHTVIWAPSGANGTPLVSTIDLQRMADGATNGGH